MLNKESIIQMKEIDTMPNEGHIEIVPPFQYNLNQCFETMEVVYGKHAVHSYHAVNNNCQNFVIMSISCFPNKLADNVKKIIVQDKIQGVLPDALVKFMTAATRIHGAHTQLSGGRINEEEAPTLACRFWKEGRGVAKCEPCFP